MNFRFKNLSQLRKLYYRQTRYFGGNASSANKQHIVVLGSGYGGYTFAKYLNKSLYDVTMVSPRNHFLFTPLLPSTTVGTLEFRAIQEPARMIKDLDFRHAKCTDVDFERSIISYEDVFKQKKNEIPYDFIVMATGSTTNTFGTPGVTEANHAYFQKQLWDARNIRKRLLECFERAVDPNISESERKRLLTFLIIGGGPISVEFSGELEDFIKTDVRKWYPDLMKDVNVTQCEGSQYILGAFEADLSSWAKRKIEQKGINIKTNCIITKIEMDEQGRTFAHTKSGEAIPYGLVVWSTGIKQVSMVEKLDLQKDRAGRVVIDSHMRVQGKKNVFAMGDCAVDLEHPQPCLAQVANQQGKFMYKLFNENSTRLYVQKDTQDWQEEIKYAKPFKYFHAGMMTNLGSYQAMVDLRGVSNDSVPGKDEDSTNVSIKGISAFIMWRSAYWGKAVSWTNKILIPMYWFKTWMFGRDISRF